MVTPRRPPPWLLTPFVLLLLAGCGNSADDAGWRVVAEVQSGQQETDGTPGLVANGGDLFWFDSIHIYRVSARGGTPAAIHTNQCGPHYGFAVDSNAVYLGTCTGTEQALASVARADGTVTQVANAQALDVALLQGELYTVHCSTGLQKVSGGSVSILAPDVGSCPTNVDTSGSRVVVMADWSAAGATIRSVDSQAGDAVVLGTGRVVAADDRRVFIAKLKDCPSCPSPSGVGWSVQGEIATVPPEGGPEQILVTAQSERHSVRGAASDGTFLYFTEVDTDSGTGSLSRVSAAGGAPTALVRDRTWPSYVAVDASNVYWWEGEAEKGGRLMAVAK